MKDTWTITIEGPPDEDGNPVQREFVVTDQLVQTAIFRPPVYHPDAIAGADMRTALELVQYSIRDEMNAGRFS